MDILGEIEKIKYKPFLTLDRIAEYNISDIDRALENSSVFMLNVDSDNKIAVSWWVSAKRTRSYPYERVYNTLNYSGKRVAIIPIFKDEGADGDRDFLQWDTVSMMSLLGVYVIIAYYEKAEKNIRAKNKGKQKITKQRFDTDYIQRQLELLLSYHSDALHWNMEQINSIDKLIDTALINYLDISNITGVKMHSEETARKRIEKLKSEKNAFMDLSRALAHKAQKREYNTLQPKENINDGEKATITINNFLGGYYYFTADEARIAENDLLLVEAKHSNKGNMPSLSDIKDGLLKMILFSNLNSVIVDDKEYNVKPILKMTAAEKGILTKKQEIILSKLLAEAEYNNFHIDFNLEVNDG